jgi:hypothetical protein
MVAGEDGVVWVSQYFIQKVADTARKGRGVDESCMKDTKAERTSRSH